MTQLIARYFLPVFLSLLIGFWSFGLRAEDVTGDNLQVELVELRQRKIDFKKDQTRLSEREILSSDERADLRKMLKAREAEAALEERHRQNYVRTLPKYDDNDAVKREAIEQKLQDRDEEAQIVREKKYARAMNARERIISQAHLEIDESKEYDLHIPKKEDHAKARTPHLKK